MFVEIERKVGDVSPISVDNWIREVRENGFTPKEAMQVLKWTNYYGNIKQVVKEIRRYNDVKVYRMFQDFIIGAIDGRETSKEAHKMLRDLAVECGFEEEFDKADKNAKVYGPRDCNVVVYFDMIKCDKRGHETVTLPDFTKGEYDVAVADCECDVRNLFDWSIYTPKKAILRNLWHVTFGDSVGDMEELVFQNVGRPDFSRTKRLPKCLRFIGCHKVDLRGANLSETDLFFDDCGAVDISSKTLLPEFLDLSGVKNVYLGAIDLSKINMIKLNGGKKVICGQKAILGEVLDLSEFEEVDLSNCDLSGVKEIKFKEGARVNLANVKNLSPDIDLSMIKDINISGLDLSYMDEMPKGWDKVKFDGNTILPKKMVFSAGEVNISSKNIANWEEIIFEPTVEKVVFCPSTKFPEKLDLSTVDEVYLCNCDLSGVKEIKFKKGAKVDLSFAKNVPSNIDLSNIEDIDISGVDLSSMEECFCDTICFGEYTCLPKKVSLGDLLEVFQKDNIKNCEELILRSTVEHVRFSKDTVFPKVFSISTSGNVYLGNNDFSNLEELKLKGKGCVKLVKLGGYPKVLDLSECENVELDASQIGEMNSIVFRDKAQRDKFMETMKFERGIDKIRFKSKCEYRTKRNIINNRGNQQIGNDMEM